MVSSYLQRKTLMLIMDMMMNRYWVGSDDHLTFPPGSSLPLHFVHNRWPDYSAYTISPAGHPNTLRLTPSFYNLTGPDKRTGTPQTFIGRRQEHVQFVFSVDVEFDEAAGSDAEAGISVFLNQGQHFDLGVVWLSGADARAAGYTAQNDTEVGRYVRLRTITANSTNEGAVDPLSSPSIVALSKSSGRVVRLQVEGVNHTTYAFKFKPEGAKGWKTVGYGNSAQVSGGFVGTLLSPLSSFFLS